MSTKFLRFIAAVMLAPGLGACGAATDQESEEQQMPPDTADVAVDEEVGESTAASVIYCRLRVDRPHKSRHHRGNVNVVAELQCNRPVPRIGMAVSLSRDGHEVQRAAFANSGNAWLQGNAATGCVSGTYQGAAAVVVAMPPRHWPGTISLRESSSRVYINCP